MFFGPCLKLLSLYFRVKRALKTLGVNIIEYEDQDSESEACLRDYCKYGCVCDSIRMRPHPPTHCGKVDSLIDLLINFFLFEKKLGYKFIEKEITTLRIYQYWIFHHTVIETWFEMPKLSENERNYVAIQFINPSIL